MAIIKCKMCGGDLVLIEGQSVAECEYCGSRQTVPSADNEKKLNLFASANKLRAACEFDRAAGVYDAIKAEFPSESEAYWGLVLCKYGIEYVDDPATGKKVPTCHRLSFDSVMDDGNLEMAMDCADSVARKVYREEAKHLEQIRTGILEVSSNEKPYDIFICYKETDENGDRTLDSVLAQDLYSTLAEKGYRVFFSRITLQSKLGEVYEPYIFAALNSAKVMLAIGTDPDYYSAVWVKNEWSRYLKICAEDKSKHLIPCYKGLDAYDLPREFRPLQGVDLGKMGAVQDILFNMEKYIPLKKQTTTVIQEKVVVGGTGGSNKIASLLDRGNMALEDGDWTKADSFFEDVLNNDSKNAQAYIGKTLAQEKCRTMDALVRKRKDVYQNVGSEKLYIGEKSAHINEMAEQYSLSGYVEQTSIRNLYRFDLSYTSEVSGRQKQYHEEELWWQNHKQLSRAEKFAVGAVAEHLQNEKKHLFAQLADREKKAQEADARSIAKLEAAYDAHIVEADNRAEKLYNDALTRRERDYENWLQQAKKENNPVQLNKLVQNFAGLGEYKDSRNLEEHCRKRAAEEQAKIDAEAERQRVIAEQKKKAQQKRNKTIAVISAVCAVLVIAVMLVVTKVIIPGNAYKEAEALLAEGNTDGAAAAFAELGSYKDAQERNLEIRYLEAEKMLANGNSYGAAKAFGAIRNYRDAWDRCLTLWGELTNRETISASPYHTAGLKDDGTVAAVGTNGYGKCDISEWTDIIAISTGTCHTVGLRNDGSVVSTKFNGNTYYGQGDVSDWTDIVAISAASSHTVGLRSDGSIMVVGSSKYGACDVGNWTDIIAVSAGDYHTVGLKSDGTVVAVGYSTQCKVNDWTDIAAISAGESHTVGLKEDGTVVAVGDNMYGQCEVSDWTDIIAISAGDYHTVGLQKDGTVVATDFTHGDFYRGQCDVSDWTDIVAISAGNSHTIGLCSDGTVVTTEITVDAFNDGQCDIGGWSDIRLPAVSEEKKAAMDAARQEREVQVAEEKKAEEERLAKEYAAAEELANNGETARAALAFGKMKSYSDARERSWKLWTEYEPETVSAGWEHTVALRNDGTVVTTGDNKEGRCNTDNWEDIVAVSAGGTHTVGLRSDGTVVAVGYNKDGRCDTGGWSDIVAVSAGMFHTIGLRSDGTVVTLGDNGQGQCDTDDWRNIVAVSAGKYHTVGLRSDGTVLAVGYNGEGQCDTEEWADIIAICAGNNHTVGLRNDGTVVAAGYDEVAEGYPTSRCDTKNWTDIVAVSAGSSHTVGLRIDGTVVSVGPDKYGQGDTDQWTDIVAISAEGWHTVGLRSDGTVVTVGWNEYGQCDTSDWNSIKLPRGR